MDWQSTFKSKKLLHLFRYKKLLTNNKQSLLRRIYVKTKWGQRFLNQHVTEKYLNPLKRELNLPSNVTLKELKPLFRFSTFKTEGVKNKKNIIIHPYASQRNKHWPHTVELIKFLANENYSFSIIGNSVKPISLPKNLEGKVKNLTNKTNLTELIRVINQSAAIITTDSGPMHLASALNIPTIALFGPTTKEFGFFPEFENCVILQDKSLICRPCHVHGGNHCSLGNRPCMNNLTVEKVAYELNQLLQIE
jgi:ADP-heptose:LPS heptosyltransferase